ncbi:MAG: DEAD/DEAH box helicase [Myxococcales bacterium]|nr:DEAD/DEAH box helicase [Myxococcales bacterium]
MTEHGFSDELRARVRTRFDSLRAEIGHHTSSAFGSWVIGIVREHRVLYVEPPTFTHDATLSVNARLRGPRDAHGYASTIRLTPASFTWDCTCPSSRYSPCVHMAALSFDTAFCRSFRDIAIDGKEVELMALNTDATGTRRAVIAELDEEAEFARWFSGGKTPVDAPIIASVDFDEAYADGEHILLLSLRKQGEKARIDPRELPNLRLREPFEGLVALADPHKGTRKSLAFTGATGAIVLHALREHPLELTKGGQPLVHDERVAQLALAINENVTTSTIEFDAQNRVRPARTVRGVTLMWRCEDGALLPSTQKNQWYFPGPNAVMVDVGRRRIYRAPGVDAGLVLRSRRLAPLEVPTTPDKLERFYGRLRRFGRDVGLAPPSRQQLGLEGAERPELTLRIEGSPLDIRATLHGRYSVGEFSLGPDEPLSPDSVRDLDVERAAFDRVREGPLRWSAEAERFVAADDDAARVWCEQVPALRAGGEPSIRVSIAEGLEGALVRRSVKSRAKVSFNQDWFELDARFSADDVSIDRAMIRAALAARRRWIALDDGTLAEITDVVRDAGAELLELLDDKGPKKLSRFALGRVDRLADGADVTLDEAASRVRERLRAVTVAPTPRVAPGLRCTLRPYQEAGLAWLQFLDELGVGGVLADDMGLGKTVTTLAYLSERKAREGAKPTLVVAPSSVLGNWVRECERFAPDLRAAVMHGAQRGEILARASEWDVLVTSYALLRSDASALGSVDFRAVIFDEAQFLKNAASVTAESARALRAGTRLALTGTPVENHLGELWAILDLVNPSMLGTARDFEQRYAKPIASRDEVSTARLRTITRPFVLRRTKREVLRELPEKEEITRVVPMTAKQRALYDGMAALLREDIERDVRAKGVGASALNVLTALLRLRQVACDPMLVDTAHENASGKREAFMELARDLAREGRRALVFSQFVSLLSLWRESLDREGIRYVYLDGATTDRDRRVRDFQEGDAPLFLISLKAGGTGLNLTAADTVIHLDPWWNPAVEEQATDRAHRMGQTRKVTVYRLVSEGSVEEKIQKLKAHKKELADAVVREQTGALAGLSEEDVRMLLGEADGAAIDVDPPADEAASAPAAASKPARAKRAAKK